MSDDAMKAKIGEDPASAVEIPDLPRNNAVYVAALNPITAAEDAKAGTATFSEATTLAEAAEQLKPRLEFEDVHAVTRLAKGAAEKAAVKVRMTYGQHASPGNIVKDFSVEHLIAMCQQMDAPAGTGEIEKKPLLNLRLLQVAVDDLTNYVKKEKLDKARAAELAQAISAEIERVERAQKLARPE